MLIDRKGTEKAGKDGVPFHAEARSMIPPLQNEWSKDES